MKAGGGGQFKVTFGQEAGQGIWEERDQSACSFSPFGYYLVHTLGPVGSGAAHLPAPGLDFIIDE